VLFLRDGAFDKGSSKSKLDLRDDVVDEIGDGAFEKGLFFLKSMAACFLASKSCKVPSGMPCCGCLDVFVGFWDLI
jgi:Ni,Fe-hydrogenase I small subunit